MATLGLVRGRGPFMGGVGKADGFVTYTAIALSNYFICYCNNLVAKGFGRLHCGSL